MPTTYRKFSFPIKKLKTSLIASDSLIKLESENEQSEDLIFDLKLPTYYKTDDLELRDKSNYIIHRGFETERNNQRQGTVSTKTRSEVRGGGRKPWRQKGTGRARAGSTRSPLWTGGGVSFGPKPKTYFKKLNKKEWRLGLRLLIAKKQKNIILVDDFSIDSAKTKEIILKLQALGVESKERSLIILPQIHQTLRLSAQNLENVEVRRANNLSIQSILRTKHLIITTESFKLIKEIYNG